MTTFIRWFMLRLGFSPVPIVHCVASRSDRGVTSIDIEVEACWWASGEDIALVTDRLRKEVETALREAPDNEV